MLWRYVRSGYWLALLLAKFILNVFFSRIEVVGKQHLARVGEGPVIFVGNHANQFLDPAILIATAQRPVGFLTAAVSMKRFLIGAAARLCQSIPVMRAQDLARVGHGKITADGLRVHGEGTLFLSQVVLGESLKVPGQATTPSVAEIVSDSELVLKFPFDETVSSLSFKVFPKLDHHQVYEKVFSRLEGGGAIGIFPEGGSHDNPHLIPLKAGVTVMALGAMDKYQSLKVKIVPVGLNYFNGHRFRSHVMVEYGPPIELSWQLVLDYRQNKRDTCDRLLQLIESRMRDVTLNYPSFQHMELVTIARRLYQPDVELSADDFIKLQRRMATFFIVLRDQPEVIQALERVEAYDAALSLHGLQDYEVQTLQPEDNRMYVLLVLRAILVLLIIVLSVPGALLNAPLGLISRYLSIREARRALLKSEVKLKAHDVVASYKVLVAMVIVPVAWTIYFLLFSFFYGLINGLMFLAALPFFSYAAIRMLESGLQIYRSSVPLLRSLWRARFVETVTELKTHRAQLQDLLRKLVRKMLPLMGPEFQRDAVATDEMFAIERRNKSHNKGSSSLLGVNRRTYKEKRADAVEDSFMDFASDFDSVQKPVILGTSVEMDRLRIFREAEEEMPKKSPGRFEDKKNL